MKCPGCGDGLKVSTQLAGKRFRCKACGEVFKVPTRKGRAKRSNLGLVLIVAALAIIPAAGIVAGIKSQNDLAGEINRHTDGDTPRRSADDDPVKRAFDRAYDAAKDELRK